MKKLLIVLALVPILFACSPKDNSKHNIALIEKYIHAVEAFDYNTMNSLLSEGYHGYGPSFNDSIGKRQAVINWRYNAENLYSSIEYLRSQNAAVIIPDGPNKGEWVSNWGELHIIYKDQEDITVWANTIYRIQDDQITKSYTFYNEADVLGQLGFVFINPDEY